eukprot:TRINITY_DN80505_c0_g1_i1.p1 TRINITY_DN80505_c0_g1~~TRINITY_DN80505_c0_g1_i1.p1  ORF type:complete len:189 (+),score=21.95 TRINITY_DN80505_c0_g1_i1:80-646(+)
MALGGNYRKLQVGYEQSHRTSFQNGHLIWQDRLHKERTARDRQLSAWYKRMGDRAPVPMDKRRALAKSQGIDTDASPQFFGAEGRLHRDRCLWRESGGPGSAQPNLDTVKGRILAQRQGRIQLLRDGMAKSDTSLPVVWSSNIPAVDCHGGIHTDLIPQEKALRHHELSAIQWRAAHAGESSRRLPLS